VLTQAAGFLLVPLYTKYFSPDEFGTLEILSRVGDIILACILVNGVKQAIFAFYLQSKDARDQRRAMGTALVLTASIAIVGGVFTMPAASVLCGFLGVDDPVLFRLVVLGLLIETLCLVPFCGMRARHEAGLFAGVSLGQFLVRVGLAIWFVAGLQLGVRGAILATILTSGCFGIVLIVREVRRDGIGLDRAMLWKMVVFALPFLPGGLGGLVMSSADRFFLLKCHGEGEVGVYALAYKLAWALPLFSVYPFWMVWCTHLYEAAERPDARFYFGRALTWFVAGLLACGLAISLFQDEVVGIIGHGKYQGAAQVIPLIVLGAACYQAALLMDAGFYVRRRTAWKMPVTLTATALAVGLYFVLIPTLGATGAGLCTLLVYLGMACLTHFASQKVFPVVYEFRRLVAMLLLASLLWTVSRFLPPSLWLTPIKIGLWLAWPLTLWVCGVVTLEEKKMVRDMADNISSYFVRILKSRAIERATESSVAD
jgi:O-antigen/teichoic acid export membrane protein